MTRSEILAHNRGVALIAALATAAADRLRLQLTERPTRYSYAIAALDGLASAAGDLALPLPPDGPENAAAALPKPRPSSDGASVHEIEAA